MPPNVDDLVVLIQLILLIQLDLVVKFDAKTVFIMYMCTSVSLTHPSIEQTNQLHSNVDDLVPHTHTYQYRYTIPIYNIHESQI